MELEKPLFFDLSNRLNEFEQIPSHFNIYLVSQETSLKDSEEFELTATEFVIRSDERRFLISQKYHELINDDASPLEDLAKINELASLYKIFDSESKVSEILTGLQFSPEAQHAPISTFSGGWKQRLSLAKALFCEPTLLLLDEPTNHLDLYAVMWLISYLQNWKRSMMIVSHDEYFLSQVATSVCKIYDRNLVNFTGGWDDFQHFYQTKLEQSEEIYRKASIKAKYSKRGGGIKIPLTRPPKNYEVEFCFLDPEKLTGGNIVEVHNVGFSYPSSPRIIFSNLEFGIDIRSRISLIGPNGAGKTTLIKLLQSQLFPTHGEIKINRKAVIAEFSQSFVEKLDFTDTPISHLQKIYPKLSKDEIWRCLASMGLVGKTPIQLISTLSGGQKSRIVLTELAIRQPHLLILDEPTNHLDIESINALIETIRIFKGAVIVISHNCKFLREISDETWLISGDGTLKILEGSVENYFASL